MDTNMAELNYADSLVEKVNATIDAVFKTERESLAKASEMLTNLITEGGVLHIFGAGHSHLFAEEITYRAGGLVPINPILDIGYTFMSGPPSRTSKLELLDGYVETICEKYEMLKDEVLIVMSQSGRNPGPVGAAIYAKKQGLQVIAVTSVGQSSQQDSKHSSGKRLFEIADIVIDNHVPFGDAAVELKKDKPKVGPLSTIIGATILQALVAETVGRLLDSDIEPPVWISANIEGGEEHNRRMAGAYPSRQRAF